MFGLTDIVIVTLLAIGASVLVGVLGYLIDKNSEEIAGPEERRPERKGV
ncbi:MAG TPA: hypothetical protein VH639_27350 [Bryobacteraceae bacterium]|jgi:hypothetical protein